MPQMSEFPFRRVHFSSEVLEALPGPVLKSLRPVLSARSDTGTDTARSLVVLRASQVIREGPACLPAWVDVDTSYLVLADVPEPALFRLPTILRVHKPDQRIHVTRDSGAVKRQAIALKRDHVLEGIVDAYLVQDDLFLVLGDMSIRCFPLDRLTFLSDLDRAAVGNFEIHSSGSFLHWPDEGLRAGASQLLQAVDPTYLAEIVIERYAAEKMSLALKVLREARGLTQSEIPGLSDRHIRRLENEEVRLTSEAALKYAEAFDTTLGEFLTELGQCLAALEDEHFRTGEQSRTDHRRDELRQVG